MTVQAHFYALCLLVSFKVRASVKVLAVEEELAASLLLAFKVAVVMGQGLLVIKQALALEVQLMAIKVMVFMQEEAAE